MNRVGVYFFNFLVIFTSKAQKIAAIRSGCDLPYNEQQPLTEPLL